MSNFFEELKNRNVYKVATAYAICSWGVIQVVNTIGPNLAWPDSIASLITRIVLVGFPIALVLTWLYEFTPQGLKLTGKVQQETTDNRKAGKRLNHIIIGVLAFTICFMLVERVFFADRTTINKTQKASIAVLPFENLSLDVDYAFFANALPARIIDELSIISGLSVTNRTSSFGAKENIQSAKEMAELLNVNYLLDGELQFDSRFNRIRISAQLINAANGYIMWSQTFEDSFDQVQDIQEKVCREVSSKLRVHLLPEEDQVLSEQITDNQEVYKLFLKAKELTMNRTEKDLLKAIELLEQAIAMEPNFAEGHAQLVSSHGLRRGYGNASKEEVRPKMKEHLDKALAIAPEKPEVLFAKATFEFRTLDEKTNVVADLRKAIEKKPGYVEAHYELYNALTATGQPELGFESLQKVLQLDPGNSFYNAMLARHLFWGLNQKERAIAVIDRQLMIAPDAPNANRLALFKSLFVVEAYGDLVESFKLKYWEYKKDPSERWNLNYGALGALGVDFWPWSEKLARTIQLRYADSKAIWNNLGAIYLFKRDMEAYEDLVNYAIQEQWLTKQEIILDKTHLQVMAGNYEQALNIFESGYPHFKSEEVLKEEDMTFENELNVIVYADLLRMNGLKEKADLYAEKLCAFYNKRTATDSEISEHRKNEMKLDCFYAMDQKEDFLRELDNIYFVKNDKMDWFVNMKSGYYLRYENDPGYQRVFKKIETEVHRQRAEVIEFLKQEDDWNPAWDKALGLE
jgi:TolB-like protein